MRKRLKEGKNRLLKGVRDEIKVKGRKILYCVAFKNEYLMFVNIF